MSQAATSVEGGRPAEFRSSMAAVPRPAKSSPGSGGMRIAAFVGDGGEVADFYEKGRLCLFERAPDRWEKVGEVSLSLDREMGLSEMKASLRAAVGRLGGCQVFLARELRGVLRVFLEERGFRVWKSEGALGDQLESVALREAEAAGAEAAARGAVPAPLLAGAPGEGRYRIDLVELLRAGSCHVSRDVLMPFFETVSFGRLEIFCEHVPRWFAGELPELGLVGESETPDAARGGLAVVVIPESGARSRPPGRRPGRSSCQGCG